MNSIQKLKELKQRNEELKPIVTKSFPPFSGQLKEYKELNKSIFDEYYANLKEIQTLEWEIMTPEEKTRRSEVSAKIKAKTKQGGNS